MKAWGLTAAALFAAGIVQAEPVDYSTTPTHTFVHAEVLHGGLSTRRMRFNRAEGRVTVDRAAGRGRVEFSVQAVEGKDLEITKEGDKVVIKFAYSKEVPLFGPASLLLRYDGQSH